NRGTCALRPWDEWQWTRDSAGRLRPDVHASAPRTRAGNADPLLLGRLPPCSSPRGCLEAFYLQLGPLERKEASVRYADGVMRTLVQLLARATIAAVIAGCASVTTVPVKFTNVTPTSPQGITAVMLRPDGAGPFPAVVPLLGC